MFDVFNFSDHKFRHRNVYAARYNAMCKKTLEVIIISNYVLAGCNKCLVYNGFYCFVLSCQDTALSHSVLEGARR